MIISFKQCNATNYRKGRTGAVQYIVIHYTANNGDTAKNNATYFANNANLYASAHYFVDENEIWQSVAEGDTAWHCGADTAYRHPVCRNYNAIGIELCSRISGGRYYFRDGTVELAAWLTRELMEKYGVTADRVVRHYDVTGKNCPAPFVEDQAQWRAFLDRLTAAGQSADTEEDNMTRYEKLSNIPNDYGFRDVVEQLMNAEVILGDGSAANVYDSVIDLSEDQVRLLVFQYRGGAFDRRFIARGMEPVVNN